MATIENRLENVENEVESFDRLMKGLIRQEDYLLKMLEGQQQHLLKHDEQIANQQIHLQKLDNLQEKQQQLMERQQQQLERQQQQLEHQQRQLEKQDERRKSMERFNLQTRRMWISMARHMNWDYEDPDLDP